MRIAALHGPLTQSAIRTTAAAMREAKAGRCGSAERLIDGALAAIKTHAGRYGPGDSRAGQIVLREWHKIERVCRRK